MRPSVAIVGRPNVGKSTLFNRLTGRRSALVSDMPGLTRDRREGEAVVGSLQLTLVDTAGLEQAASGSIAARMREQSEAAIRAADLVLFVIDARAGVTPDDTAFARIIRAAGRPVILVANKSEGRAAESGFYEAYQLGFGDPVAISAEHGEGLGDLAYDIESALKAMGSDPAGLRETIGEDAENMRPMRVAIVGRPNAGKSTLVNALVGEDRMITGPEPGLTRDAVSTEVRWGERAITIFDTAGLRRKARVTDLAEKLSASDAIRAIRFAEVVILVVDAERPLEKQDLTIGDLTTEEGRALVIAVNKWDLVEDKQKTAKALRETLADSLSQVPGVALVPISALAEQGLDKLKRAVIETHALWNKRVSTPDLNRWLAEALTRHAPPASRGRRVKIRYITQPSARPPTFAAFCSRPAELPASYIRYLVNSLRDAFGLPGVPIRLNIRKGENPYADRKSRR